MQGKLKQRHQVQKEVSRRGYFEGRIDVADLRRLVELLASSEGQIDVKFEFILSDYSIPMVTGQIKTRLQVECQRCLLAMPVDIELEFSLLIDATDDLVRESSIDTLFSDEGFVDIFEAIEDEIILALPLVTMHENETCNKHWLAAEETQGPVVNENPFSVLKELKKTN